MREGKAEGEERGREMEKRQYRGSDVCVLQLAKYMIVFVCVCVCVCVSDLQHIHTNTLLHVQDSGATLARGEPEYAEQFWHVVAPLSVEYVPRGQSTQSDSSFAPIEVRYLPGLQRVQLGIPSFG